MNNLWTWALARLQEPSTWRGLIGIASACGVVIQPQFAAAILAAGIGLAGFINVITKDPKNVGAIAEAAVQDVVIPAVEAVNTPVSNAVTH